MDGEDLFLELQFLGLRVPWSVRRQIAEVKSRVAQVHDVLRESSECFVIQDVEVPM